MLADLNRRLARHGLALENLGDIDQQTLAGSVSTATHGTGARFGNLSSQIESMELIGARRQAGRAERDRPTPRACSPRGSGSARSASSTR